jgi:hypothetical protein
VRLPAQVDAALDATNVARVAHYIRTRTRTAAQRGGRRAGGAEGDDEAAEPHGFQSIVISLKASGGALLGSIGGVRCGPFRGRQAPRGGWPVRDAPSTAALRCAQDIFYEKADSLVGVCRDLDRASSATFTFDLSRFEEPLPDA